MTLEEAIKVNEARSQCIRNRTYGTVAPCNVGACDGCLLNYEQGNMGEQKQALDVSVKAMKELVKIKEIYHKQDKKLDDIHIDNRGVYERFFWEVWRIFESEVDK